MVVHAYYPLAESRVEREARAAADAGYAVDIICLRAPDEPAFETVDGLRITRLPVEKVRGGGAGRAALDYASFTLRATFATLRLHRQHPIDVVHVHAPPDFLIVSALIPRLLGSGVVLDIHDLSGDLFDARFGNRRLAGAVVRCLEVIERGACAIAHRVITVHDAYRNELSSHGVPADRIDVVMNAPDDQAIIRALAEGGSAASNSFVVAYHGTVTPWYGVDLLVEAVAHLRERVPHLRALILGIGDGLASAEQLAQTLGVDDRITFSREFLPHHEALRQVAGASCGVIPNRRSRLNRFALSSKLLEYVALDIPVVVARLETLAAHFAPEEVTFFEPDDARSLAEALAWVAEHPAEARAKAERARTRAEEYSWSASRERLVAALASAASRRG
jgi:glycosyltransferase involved in cell wall biosynthesis